MYALIPILAIVGGFVVAGLSIYHRTRLKELAYRERIAMIERGLVPPPEANPAAFDELWHGGVARRAGDQGSRAARCLTAGIILIGVGLMIDDDHQLRRRITTRWPWRRRRHRHSRRGVPRLQLRAGASIRSF